ncbi:MAG: ECF-type sigma factor [bacterium]|nr:ECF-type sigma factor [bacterium]
MSDVTRILSRISSGDAQAASELLPLVYAELRQLATARMVRESANQTLQPTALVHEAYLRLLKGDEELEWDNRGHFFAAAAEAMRRILIENARRKKSAKHGGKMSRNPISENDAQIDERDVDGLLALDDAMTKLAQDEPSLAELVKIRYFTGLTVDEAAKALGISSRTAKRNWAYARAWLRREIEGN